MKRIRPKSIYLSQKTIRRQMISASFANPAQLSLCPLVSSGSVWRHTDNSDSILNASPVHSLLFLLEFPNYTVDRCYQTMSLLPDNVIVTTQKSNRLCFHFNNKTWLSSPRTDTNIIATVSGLKLELKGDNYDQPSAVNCLKSANYSSKSASLRKIQYKNNNIIKNIETNAIT